MLGKTIEQMSDAMREWIISYGWPGNVRELYNVIEYAVNVEDSNLLTIDSLPPHLTGSLPSQTKPNSTTFQLSNKEKQRVEKLRNILQENGWGKSGKQCAAEFFGVSLATIYRWAKAYSLQRPKK